MYKLSKVLDSKSRAHIAKKNFGIPSKAGNASEKKKTGNYPIHDKAHARAALAYGSRNLSSSEYAALRKRVHAKYPDMAKKAAFLDGYMSKEALSFSPMMNWARNSSTLRRIKNAYTFKRYRLGNALGRRENKYRTILDSVRKHANPTSLVRRDVERVAGDPTRYRVVNYIKDPVAGKIKVVQQVVSRDVLLPSERTALRNGTKTIKGDYMKFSDIESRANRIKRYSNKHLADGALESTMAYGVPLGAGAVITASST